MLWCIPGSLSSGFFWSWWRENVPGIPGACTTPNFTYLVRGPLTSTLPNMPGPFFNCQRLAKLCINEIMAWISNLYPNGIWDIITHWWRNFKGSLTKSTLNLWHRKVITLHRNYGSGYLSVLNLSESQLVKGTSVQDCFYSLSHKILQYLWAARSLVKYAPGADVV